MLEDCYLKTSGFFQSFWEGTGRSNGFLFVFHCRLPMSEIRLPVTVPFILSLAEGEYRSLACWRGSTFPWCKILWCICAGPLRLYFQKWLKLVWDQAVVKRAVGGHRFLSPPFFCCWSHAAEQPVIPVNWSSSKSGCFCRVKFLPN